MKIRDNESKLSDFDSSKKEILVVLNEANYHDLEEMVNRMQLTYDEIMDQLDIKFYPS